jgi:tetratricopeptide (TPR) repeat protein
MKLRVEVPDSILEEVVALLDGGKALSAWNLAQSVGPLENWSYGRPLGIAAKLATRVGKERLGRLLHWINWRDDRNDPARYFEALFARLRWKTAAHLIPEIHLKMTEFGSRMSPTVQSDLLSMKAWLAGSLRDFGPAHKAIEAALNLTPESSWTHVQHSALLEIEDRYEEALAAARTAVRFGPLYFPAVMQVSTCLVHLGRDEEAIELLLDAHEKSEQSGYVIQLQVLYSDRGDHVRAKWCLDELERLRPMMSDKTRKWLEGRRADFHYMADDLDAALEWSSRNGEGFYRDMAARLADPEAKTRRGVRLDVPFIRQHNMTCAPATLASLAKYWGRDHDHLSIAESICYNGTPWHKERDWAIKNGFVALEFRLTKEVLVALIDRRLPFTLTTSWVTNAHLQACIGYDDRIGTIILRDPTIRHFGESYIDELIDSHRIYGPRCMLMVPDDQTELIEGLQFPDQHLYDGYHELSVGFDKHDRMQISRAVATMRAIDPDHALTILAESHVAGYLGHHSKQLDLLNRLQERFPDQQFLRSQRFSVLQQLGDHAGAFALLKEATAKPDCDSSFVSDYGELLTADARRLPLAGHYLRRAIRMNRGSSRPLESLARWHDKKTDFRESARLRRYASTLDLTSGFYAEAYFNSCRAIGHTRDGIEFLRERISQLGRLSSEPWLTCARALDAVGRSSEAKELLEEAIGTLPEDGALQLQAGRLMVAWGKEEREKGLAWMDAARGRVLEARWLRERAEIAGFLGDRTLASRLWRTLLSTGTHSMDAYRSLARLIAEEEGEAAAIEFLRAATIQHPQHYLVWTLLAQWTNDPQESVEAWNRALEIDPDDSWSRRHRADKRFELGDREGGIRDCHEALERDSHNCFSYGVLADLLYRDGKVDEANRRVREALRLNIDYPWAIGRLVAWAPGQAEEEDAIRFLEEEMDRQVSNGDCVTEYQIVARKVLTPVVLLEKLRRFCSQRPDLWQTWSARLSQALQMDLPLEAATCTEHLINAFPLLPRTWIEVARARHAAGDFTGEVEALQRAVDISPAWDLAARELAAALQRLNHYDEAEHVLRKAIQHDPLNSTNLGTLADLLLKRGKDEEAWTLLQEAIKIGPYYSLAWATLAGLSQKLGRTPVLLEQLETFGARYGTNPEWWNLAADVHRSLGDVETALAAVQKGLELAPNNVNARDQIAIGLCELGRYDEALAICSQEAASEPLPLSIKGRRAWVLMQSGNGPTAIREMTSLLKEFPSYIWGWYQLSIWYSERSDWPNLARAAGEWARFDPDNSIAHGHVGLAAEKQELAELAKRAFQRAYILDPEYAYVGRKLLALQIDSKDYQAAQETLASLRHYTPGPSVECDAIHLALEMQQPAQALDMALNLAKTATTAEPLFYLNELFTQRELGGSWRQRLKDLLSVPTSATPAVASAWVAFAQTPAALAAARRTIGKLSISEESQNAAWAVLLRKAAEVDQPLLRKWIKQERPRFQADPELWNLVGELLAGITNIKDAVGWFQGWEHRPKDVSARTLANLVTSLDDLKGPAHASSIRMEALSRFPSDPTTHRFRAAEASYRASNGRISEAETFLEALEDSLLPPYYVAIANLARSVIAAARNDETKARTYYQTALETINTWPQDAGLRHYLHDAQGALANHLPWARGSRRRIIKRWKTVVGYRSPAKQAVFSTLYVILVVVLILAGIGVASVNPVAGLMLLIFTIGGLIKNMKVSR